MKFAITVLGAPYSSQAPVSALNFARAVVSQGHELVRVFFYQEGVYTGSIASSPPQDELNIVQAWRDFAHNQNIELIVCVASALRRGMLNSEEADRYEKDITTLAPEFEISGLGQLIDANLNADRVVTFGD